MSTARKYEVDGILIDNNGASWHVENFWDDGLNIRKDNTTLVNIRKEFADCMEYVPPKPKSQPDVWIPKDLQNHCGDWPMTEAIERAIQSLHGKPSEWVRKADVADVLVDRSPPHLCTILWAKLKDLGITPDMAKA